MRSFRALCHDQRAAIRPHTDGTAFISNTTPMPLPGLSTQTNRFCLGRLCHAAPLGRRETTTAHPPTAFRTSASKIQPGNPYASAIHLSALLLRAIFRQLCISIFLGKDRHITYTSPLGSPAGIGADLYTYINVYHPRAAASPRSNLNHFFMFLQLTWLRSAQCNL